MSTEELSVRPAIPYDVCDRLFYRDPWSAYQWLRENRPVGWDERNQLWVVATHREVSHVSRHPETFCSGQGVRPYQSFDLSLLALDGDKHFRQRQIVSRGFTPRIVSQLEDRIRRLTAALLDSFAGRDEVDFVDDLAAELPLQVIAELMGFPLGERHQLRKWSDDMMGGEGHTDESDPYLVAATTAAMEYVGYVSAIIEERRRINDPDATDLISVLVRAEDAGLFEKVGETLDDSELLFFLVLLIVAGNETTRNAMSGGMVAFDHNPDEWQRFETAVRDNETTVIASATEEILRYVTPVLSFARTATTAADLGGQAIAAGEKVLLMYQSANRDPAVFADPDSFRIDRSPNPHLAFGIGPHFCLGANLARLEIRVVFEELAKRYPNVHVRPGTEASYPCANTLVHAIDHLPVRLTR